MPENDIIKSRILELLADRSYTKEELKQVLWIESDRKIDYILRDLRRSNLIYLHNKQYHLEPKTREKKQVKSRTKRQEKKPYQVYLLRGMFALLSVGASIMSVRNTSVWLLESFPPFFAYLLSGIMSIFMIASMGVAVLLWIQKKYAVSIIVALMWAIITLTSVSSTVIGMYNVNKESFIQKQTVSRLDRTNEMLYNELEQQEDDIQRLIDDRTTSMKRANERIQGLALTDPLYKKLSDEIFQAENFIRVRTAEKREVANKKIGLLETFDDTEVLARTFYEEMEILFGISAAMIHFILSCFVAILVDSIAPLSASLALFLKEDAHEADSHR